MALFLPGYFLLHIPEQLLMQQEGIDIYIDLDNLWLGELFKMFLSFLFSYIASYTILFLYTWESAEAFVLYPQY